MKSIAIFSTVHKVYDVRIFHKEIKALKDSYKIFYFNPNVEEEKKEDENIFLKKLKKRKNRFLRIIFSPFDTFFQLVGTDYSLYHFHDPELLITGILLKIFGKRVVFDSHENNYGLIIEKTYLKPYFLKFLIAKSVRFFELVTSYFFDGLIVARPDLEKLYKNKNILVFRNFPDIDFKIEDGVKKFNEKPIVVYSGGLTYIRGITQLVDAVGLLNGKVELHLLGEWQDKGLKEDCEKRKGYKYTKYLGNFPYGEHFKFIKEGDIGIVPFLPAQNHLTTLPNKPFEYFLCKIPVLMSNFDYWKNTFKDIAFFFDPLSPEDIKKKILYLLENKEFSKKLVENAYKKVQKEFNWNKEKDKLLDFYKKLLKN